MNDNFKDNKKVSKSLAYGETVTVCSKAEPIIISEKERAKLKLKLSFYLSVAPVGCVRWGRLLPCCK